MRLQGSSHVVHDPSDSGDVRTSGQILTFRPRRSVAPLRRPLNILDDYADESIDDLARYEDEDININYRHRMLMNLIAVVIVSSLVGVGVWIADTIADMEKVQDCAMQGRQNCAPIELPLKK